MQTKKFLLYILLVVATVSLTGGCQVQASSGERSSGGQTKENRNVATFKSIDLAISANVILKQGGPQSVVLEGDANDLEKVVTEVSGSELKIKTKPGSWNMKRVDVYITVQDIENLKISGSGSIKNDGAIKGDEMELVISGSGSIHISDLAVKNISAVISGSGSIDYSGTSPASESKLVVTGSGNINADGLASKNAQVNITGSGDCKVNAEENLNVQITGSGSVMYKGKALINADVTGSGKVRQM